MTSLEWSTIGTHGTDNMIKVRQHVFETNSSSTHVMVLSEHTQIFKEFLERKAVMISWSPEWMNDMFTKSGTGTFISDDALVDVIKKNVDRLSIDNKDELESLQEYDADELCEWVNDNVEDLSVYSLGWFEENDGDKQTIDVNGTSVTSVGAAYYDG